MAMGERRRFLTFTAAMIGLRGTDIHRVSNQMRFGTNATKKKEDARASMSVNTFIFNLRIKSGDEVIYV